MVANILACSPTPASGWDRDGSAPPGDDRDYAPCSAVPVLEGVDRLEIEVPVLEGSDGSYCPVRLLEPPHKHGESTRWRRDVRAYTYLTSSPSAGKVLVLKDVTVDVD